MLTVDQLLNVIRLDRDLKSMGSALREDDLPRKSSQEIGDEMRKQGFRKARPLFTGLPSDLDE